MAAHLSLTLATSLGMKKVLVLVDKTKIIRLTVPYIV